jgi:hypothetical protein
VVDRIFLLCLGLELAYIVFHAKVTQRVIVGGRVKKVLLMLSNNKP